MLPNIETGVNKWPTLNNIGKSEKRKQQTFSFRVQSSDLTSIQIPVASTPAAKQIHFANGHWGSGLMRD